MENKYFYISSEKEKWDTSKLIRMIDESGWVANDTILVNCSPDYSSIITQHINHRLSYLNSNELFEVIDLEMPYPTMSQVWDRVEKEYQTYIKYLSTWVYKHLKKDNQYLFIDSGTCRGSNFARLKAMINGRIDEANYRTASLYLQSDSIFTPDFYVEKFDKEKQGGLLFEWENLNNPNWDY